MLSSAGEEREGLQWSSERGAAVQIGGYMRYPAYLVAPDLKLELMRLDQIITLLKSQLRDKLSTISFFIEITEMDAMFNNNK